MINLVLNVLHIQRTENGMYRSSCSKENELQQFALANFAWNYEAKFYFRIASHAPQTFYCFFGVITIHLNRVWKFCQPSNYIACKILYAAVYGLL